MYSMCNRLYIACAIGCTCIWIHMFSDTSLDVCIHMYTYITCIHMCFDTSLQLWHSSDTNVHISHTPLMQRCVQPTPLWVTYSKAQSSKLERLFCHVSVERDVRALSFELWNSIRRCHPKWDWLYTSLSTALIDTYMCSQGSPEYVCISDWNYPRDQNYPRSREQTSFRNPLFRRTRIPFRPCCFGSYSMPRLWFLCHLWMCVCVCVCVCVYVCVCVCKCV